MKVISIIGHSNTGKTQFIVDAIRLLKDRLNYHVIVIKYIHEHEIDKEGKDSYKFNEAGAQFSILKNIFNEHAIFLKQSIKFEQLIEWILKSPFQVDFIFTEGLRDSTLPTVLCIKDLEEVKNQLNNNVLMISGLICANVKHFKINNNNPSLPIVDINKEFEKFLKIFNIK